MADKLQFALSKTEQIARHLTVGPLTMVFREHPIYGPVYVALGKSPVFEGWCGAYMITAGPEQNIAQAINGRDPDETIEDAIESAYAHAVYIGGLFKQRSMTDDGFWTHGKS